MPRFLLFTTNSGGRASLPAERTSRPHPAKHRPGARGVSATGETRRAPFQNREHFLAICAQLMRQILVEYARSRNAAKRDGGYRLTLDDNLAFKTQSVDMVALDDALNELAKLDPQQSRIVELRFFGGLSIEETSRALNLSPTTVKRHWATARLWLHHQMKAAEA